MLLTESRLDMWGGVRPCVIVLDLPRRMFAPIGCTPPADPEGLTARPRSNPLSCRPASLQYGFAQAATCC